MSLDDIFALVSLAGFATQRTLELLDPLFVTISKLKIFEPFFDGDQKTAKAWCMAIAGFGIGLVIALSDGKYQLPGVGAKTSAFVIALAISMGSNATNSLLKFGESVKEARKKVAEPLPQIVVTPATVTVAPSAHITFLASVSVTDNRNVMWHVLEADSGGTVTPAADGSSAQYAAPATPGTYHLAVVSAANTAATATAIITVKAA